jgi:hypothetical protein
MERRDDEARSSRPPLGSIDAADPAIWACFILTGDAAALYPAP